MKRYLFITVFITGFIIFGYSAERMPCFKNLREQLRRFTIPSPPLRLGKRGEIMEKLGLKYVVPREYSKYFNPKTREFSLKDIIGLQSTRHKADDRWTVPEKVDPANFPSSMIMDQTVVQSGLPVLSVVIDENDLYDERTGIFANHQKKGKKWERISFISYYNHGKLLFASGAGVRVHGGGDRSMKYKGMRFYFRDVYGADHFKDGILFSKKRKPVQRIIVRKEPVFFNAIALDISRKIGCIAPYTQPVKVFLNGTLYDEQFVLTEHISKDYLFSLYGHEEFLLERTIKRRRGRSDAFNDFKEWARNKEIRMTMEEVGKRVNIQNLSLWWISQLICAGKDHYQGPAVLDKKNTGSKWFWINWDMDQSIQNTREKDRKIWEQELCLKEVMESTSSLDRKDPRGVLFRRMMNEDPAYRSYFETLLADVLNHRLPFEFLESRIRYYEKKGNQLGVDAFYNEDVRTYFKKRPAYLRGLMRRYFNAPNSYLCRINPPRGSRYKVDGYPYQREYAGWYLKGSKITINRSSRNENSETSWFVNGKKVVGKNHQLTLTVDSNTTIEWNAP